MTNINYEAEVKRVYPDAEFMYTGYGYFIYNLVFLPQTIMSDFGLIEESTWQSAYEKLKQQGKI